MTIYFLQKNAINFLFRGQMDWSMVHGNFEFSKIQSEMLETKSCDNSKWPQIPLMTSYQKNDNLFSPTLKIEENKVPLCFGLELKWMGHGHWPY